MVEAVILLCLSGTCREALLPGYESQSPAACEARLADRPPDLARFGDAVGGRPVCRPAGEALALREIAPGVLVHEGLVEEPSAANRGDVANLGVIIGNTSVVVIDAGSARWMGEALLRAIRARTPLPVSHVVLTHNHPDHVLGASVLAEAGAVIVAHAGLARALADRQASYLARLGEEIGPAFSGTSAPSVDSAVEGERVIDAGGRLVRLRAWPLAHSAGDLTALDVSSGVLFAGDLLFDRHCPALDGSLKGWLALLPALSALPAQSVVPGHGGPVLPWPQALGPQTAYLTALESGTRAAIAAGERLDTALGHVGRAGSTDWTLCEVHTPRNVTNAFTELEWE